MKLILFTFLIVSLFSGVTAQTKTAIKKQKTTQTGSKIVYEPDAEMLRNLREKVRVTESKQDWTEFNRQSPAVNLSKTLSAYTAKFKMEDNPEILFDVVVVHDSKTDKFYEIRGIEDFPGRPLSDFKWISNDVLQFEHWVNPKNGGRYQVNLKTGKIIAAGYIRSS